MRKPFELKALVRSELSLGAGPRRTRRVVSFWGVTVALVALTGSFGSSPLLAQPPFRQELLPQFSTIDAGERSSPAVADLDGDGDVDVAVGIYTGSVVYFENTGSSSVPSFVERIGSENPFVSIDAVLGANPELADVDGDGDFDAVVGNIPGALTYFENTGTSLQPSFVERSGSANPFPGIAGIHAMAPDLADLDGDGDLDAAIGVSSGFVHYFENTGSVLSPAFVERTGSANPLAVIQANIGVGYGLKPELADFDGDGDFDVAVGMSAGNLRYFRNTGSSTAPAFVEVLSGNPFPGIDVGTNSDPQLTDLDGDGDLDLLTGQGYGSLPFYENTGSSLAPALVEKTGSVFQGFSIATRYACPELADLDGDGDLDVTVGFYSGGLRYFENSGSPVLMTLVELTGTASPFAGLSLGTARNPKFIDLDGDGDYDGVVGDGGGTLKYFENAGSSSTPSFLERFGGANPFSGIVIAWPSPDLADFDGDGDFDAVVGDFFGNLHYFKNTGSSSGPSFVEQTGSGNPLSGFTLNRFANPEIVDFDSDGDFDVVAGRAGDPPGFFENTGSSASPAFVERTGGANPLVTIIDSSFGSSPELADIDADGDIDLFLGDSQARVIFYRSLAEVTFFADGFETGDTSGWSSVLP